MKHITIHEFLISSPLSIILAAHGKLTSAAQHVHRLQRGQVPVCGGDPGGFGAARTPSKRRTARLHPRSVQLARGAHWSGPQDLSRGTIPRLLFISPISPRPSIFWGVRSFLFQQAGGSIAAAGPRGPGSPGSSGRSLSRSGRSGRRGPFRGGGPGGLNLCISRAGRVRMFEPLLSLHPPPPPYPLSSLAPLPLPS